MTANETRPAGSDLLEAIAVRLREGLVLVAKVAIAGLLIIAAGVLAVATAIAGLVIAGIAILLRFIGRQAGHPSTRRRAGTAGTITLEARRTGHGWTVE